MTPQKFFKTTLIITLGIFLMPALIVVIFDPFFVFHKPFVHKDIGFDGTDRYQNAGLINSYLADPDEKIDTIIVGTSMSQNLPVSVFQNEHGVNALKLTLSGGKPKELAMLVNKALETGQVKHVVWEIFTAYASDNPDLIHKESPLPQFLYNESAFDNWRYIFNNDVVEEAMKVAIGKKKKRKPLEHLYTWENEEQFKRFNSPENVQKLRDKLSKSTSPLKKNYDVDVLEFPNIEKNLLPILQSNPDVEFSLFFPPTSYYGHAVKGNDQFWKQMKMRTFLLESAGNLDNATIYGFDLKSEWGGNLSNYMDDHHYALEISESVSLNIKNKKHILNESDFLPYAEALINKIHNFTENF